MTIKRKLHIKVYITWYHGVNHGTTSLRNHDAMVFRKYIDVTCLGVARVEGDTLTLQDYIDVLYNHKYIEKPNRGFHFNKTSGGLSYTETEKLALNPIFNKFLVQSDNITCKPLVDPNSKELL